jgi:4-hydroxybenzoate polyprenyltransferase
VLHNFVKTILSALRAFLWWNHLSPPVLAVFYFFLWHESIAFGPFLLPLGLFLLSFAGSAAFGYWVNDWMDIAADRLAGKPNAVANMKPWQRIGVTLILQALGWLPWLYLPATYQTLGLLVALYTALVVYAVPPYRFKDRAILGIVCDLCYGHLIPVFIALAAFSQLLGAKVAHAGQLLWIIAIILSLKGMRNILEHQIKDRKNDALAGIYTFVQQIGALRSAAILSYILLPLEAIGLVVLCLIFGSALLWSLLLFFAIYAWLLFRWGYFKGSPKRWLFRLWYVPNDFYEAWLPLTLLILATAQQPLNGLLLLAHLIIFPGTLQVPLWLLKELRDVWHQRTN